jgi:cellobiose phosphorylase
LRQANCYYSSSDAAFDDRYQASAEYQRVAQGTVPFDGGWRGYSSGAGIAFGLVVHNFLGLRCESQRLCVDPVIPDTLDGLRVRTSLLGRAVEVSYRIGAAGCGVSRLQLNGQPLHFERDANPHRTGAALVDRAMLSSRMSRELNTLAIELD